MELDTCTALVCLWQFVLSRFDNEVNRIPNPPNMLAFLTPDFLVSATLLQLLPGFVFLSCILDTRRICALSSLELYRSFISGRDVQFKAVKVLAIFFMSSYKLDEIIIDLAILFL